MSEIATFQFPATGQQIRTFDLGGKPWFLARDLAAVLDLSNIHSSLAALDEDEKGLHSMDTPSGVQQFAVVNESGLYSLILRSRRPEAKAFRKWVTGSVLPAIRTTGGYGTVVIPDMSTPEGRLQILDMAVRAEQRALALESKVKELEPDAARARQTLHSEGMSLVRTVAKRFGIKEKALREFLHAEQLLIRGGSSHNEPYARYVQSGHFEVKTTLVEIDPDRAAQAKSTTYVTPKGEALIWKRLHDAGYVSSPVIPPKQLELLSA